MTDPKKKFSQMFDIKPSQQEATFGAEKQSSLILDLSKIEKKQPQEPKPQLSQNGSKNFSQEIIFLPLHRKKKKSYSKKERINLIKKIFLSDEYADISKERKIDNSLRQKAEEALAATEKMPPEELLENNKDLRTEEEILAEPFKEEDQTLQEEKEDLKRELEDESSLEEPLAEIEEQLPDKFLENTDDFKIGDEILPQLEKPLDKSNLRVEDYLPFQEGLLDEKQFNSNFYPEALPTKDQILVELAQWDKAEDSLSSEKERSLKKKTKKKKKLKNQLLSVAQKNDFNIDLAKFENIETEVDYLFKEKKPKLIKFNKKSLGVFLVAALIVSLIVPGLGFLNNSLKVKKNLMGSSLAAYTNLLQAQDSLQRQDWALAQQEFDLASLNFDQINKEIKSLGQLTLGALGFLAGQDLLASSQQLVEIGEGLAEAGKKISRSAAFLVDFGLTDILSPKTAEFNLADQLLLAQNDLSQALNQLSLTKNRLSQLDLNKLPSEVSRALNGFDQKMTLINLALEEKIEYLDFLAGLLGGQTLKEYLFVFQNNSQLRAGGGFIGSYSLLRLEQGQLADILAGDIFNLDSQLKEKIIPPVPIQKTDTSWAIHSANWFLDWPTSADKINWFYEKITGHQADGVIGLTPTLIEEIIKITGPITMTDYDLTLTADNFVELIQYEVEENYDPKLNQPAKIVADLTPELIKRINQFSKEEEAHLLEVIFKAFEEKQLLVYFTDSDLNKFVRDKNWAGQVLETDKDYLSVVSSNIGGAKTDKVIDQQIGLKTEIESDGSIVNTLTIVRQHRGNNFNYSFWNSLNTNYLRVYLPKGSQLISAKGYSQMTVSPPINYQANGFVADSLLKSIEATLKIDPLTKTEIFEESAKTVFANWFNVAPGKTATLVYKYRLPFKIDLTKAKDDYSLLVQKQPGDFQSHFELILDYPQAWQVTTQLPENLSEKIKLNTDKKYHIDFNF